MGGFLLHVGATIYCPHAGQVTQFITTNTKVLVSGQAVVTEDDEYTITGCTHVPPPPSQKPCISINWTSPAKHVLINGHQAVLQDSIGTCQVMPMGPQDPPNQANVSTTQQKVEGT